jgi:hypothetical protein
MRLSTVREGGDPLHADRAFHHPAREYPAGRQRRGGLGPTLPPHPGLPGRVHMSGEVRRTFATLFPDGGVVELRA